MPAANSLIYLCGNGTEHRPFHTFTWPLNQDWRAFLRPDRIYGLPHENGATGLRSQPERGAQVQESSRAQWVFHASKGSSGKWTAIFDSENRHLLCFWNMIGSPWLQTLIVSTLMDNSRSAYFSICIRRLKRAVCGTQDRVTKVLDAVSCMFPQHIATVMAVSRDNRRARIFVVIDVSENILWIKSVQKLGLRTMDSRCSGAGGRETRPSLWKRRWDPWYILRPLFLGEQNISWAGVRDLLGNNDFQARSESGEGGSEKVALYWNL